MGKVTLLLSPLHELITSQILPEPAPTSLMARTARPNGAGPSSFWDPTAMSQKKGVSLLMVPL